MQLSAKLQKVLRKHDSERTRVDEQRTRKRKPRKLWGKNLKPDILAMEFPILGPSNEIVGKMTINSDVTFEGRIDSKNFLEALGNARSQGFIKGVSFVYIFEER